MIAKEILVGENIRCIGCAWKSLENTKKANKKLENPKVKDSPRKVQESPKK